MCSINFVISEKKNENHEKREIWGPQKMSWKIHLCMPQNVNGVETRPGVVANSVKGSDSVFL